MRLARNALPGCVLVDQVAGGMVRSISNLSYWSNQVSSTASELSGCNFMVMEPTQTLRLQDAGFLADCQSTWLTHPDDARCEPEAVKNRFGANCATETAGLPLGNDDACTAQYIRALGRPNPAIVRNPRLIRKDAHATVPGRPVIRIPKAHLHGSEIGSKTIKLSRGRHYAEEVRQSLGFPGGLFIFLRIIFDSCQSASNQSSTLWSRFHEGWLSVFGLSTRSSAQRLVSRFAWA